MMKKRKWIMIGSLSLLLLGVTGCGNNNGQDETNNTTTVPAATEQTQPTDNGEVSATQSPDASGTDISQEEAIKIALKEVKGAKESDIHIHKDRDDGRDVYEGSILYNEMEYEFEIDASDGKILEWDEESIYDD